MIEDFKEFKSQLNAKTIKMFNSRFDKTIQTIDFRMIFKDEIFDLQTTEKIELIIMSSYQKNDEKYIIVCFNRKLIISELDNEPFISFIFSEKNINKICFVPGSKFDFLDRNLIKMIKQNENQEEIDYLATEVDNFTENFQITRKSSNNTIRKFWEIISPCISTYLIKKNHVKNCKDRMKFFFEKIDKTRELKNYEEEDFICLRPISTTQSSIINLQYHIESEKIFVIKKFNILEDESTKLNRRELNNYKCIKYPLLPKLYGKIENNNNLSLVIEYINGKTLDKINKEKLIFEQRLMIIIEILYTFQYLHRNKFIYRDLKPNNLIIDQNYNLVLIDFDRMIKNNKDELMFTADLNSPFLAEELKVKNCIPSYENDIYSIGRMIYYIITGNQDFINDEFQQKYPTIFNIVKQCCNENPKERPSIDDLIRFFDTYIFDIANSSLIRNIEINISLLVILDYYSRYNADRFDIEAEVFICFVYYEGKYITKDINKCAYYLSLGVYQNPLYSQYIIGFIYQQEVYIDFNIIKSIHYLTLSADQNHPEAQTLLGNLYQVDDVKDINKCIKYYNLASKQNHPYASMCLGYLYMEGQDVDINLDKSIYYYELAEKYYANKFTPYIFAQLCWSSGMFPDEYKEKAIFYYKLAAEQNDVLALDQLGDIYFKGENVLQDVNEGIRYYSLAADQNYIYTIIKLGDIYYEGEYIPQDIDKAIFYYLRYEYLDDPYNKNWEYSGYLNIMSTILKLADFYFEGKNVPRNIDKAIHYYTLSADHKDLNAIKKLADFYFEGKYVTQNIVKAIHYYSLSANLFDNDSIKKLADIYFEGKNVPRNIDKATHYYSLSANLFDNDSIKKLADIYFEEKHYLQAIYYYSLSADQNDLNAIKKLADIYFEGKYVLQNIEKAIHYYALAADQNDLNATKKLADIYFKGNISPQNIIKIIHCFKLAADENHIISQFVLGTIFYEGIYVQFNINKSIHYFKLAADKNHIISQFVLGTIFYEGIYVQFNINKSIHYFKLAADQNHIHSQFILGFIYYEGRYIARDINKAIYYFTLAADKNDSNSQYILGIIYYEGKYLTHNIDKAIQYFSLAESQDHSLTKNILRFLFYERTYHKNDIEKIIHYFTLLAKRNDQFAQFYLGVIYYEDKYVKRDINKAILYLKQSAKQNNPNAQNNLGYIYYKGEYVNRDINLAISYFLAAAEQDDPIAENNLGYIYYENNNSYNLFYYFIRSISKNYSIAQYNLGSIYYEGEKLVQEIDKGIHYLSLAADQGFPQAQYKLGVIYYFQQDIKKSFKYMSMACKNNIQPAILYLGDMYFEGRYIKRDIKKAFNLYKKVSSFNNQYAKNNLGIIYKNGYGVVNQCNDYAEIYFREAIRFKNDCLSMFNLANILLEKDDKIDQEHKESIKLLIDSSNQGLIQSHLLLCLILYKQHKYVNLQIIENELKKYNKESYELSLKIFQTYLNLSSIDDIYRILNSKDLIYIHYQVTQLDFIQQSEYLLSQEDDYSNKYHQLYEGFGYDLLKI